MKKKMQLPPLESKPSNDDIVNAILPPRDWAENSKVALNNGTDTHYVQYVSHKPSERDEVATLNKELDKHLTERQARDNGICPIREELFSQVFDEIIRQVALNSAERGLLLHRVKDELKMSIAAYQTLYNKY